MKSIAETAAPTAAKSRKHFDSEFQKEAVRLLEAGRSATQLARELGVSTWSLTRWKKLHGVGGAAAGCLGRSTKAAGEGDVNTVELAAEVARLKSELYTVTRQREILKKALAILGQEPAPFMS
jgi:transposase-like protein